MKQPKFYRDISYDPSLLPNAFLAEKEKMTTCREDWVEHTGYSIGNPGWGLLYYMLLSTLDPHEFNVIVETGTNLGSTTIMLAQALIDSGRGGHIHTVEIDPRNHAEAEKRLVQAGVSEVVTCHCGNSVEVLEEIVNGVEKIRMAFLDGSHLLEIVFREFQICYPKLEKTSVVAFDNTYKITENGEPPRVFEALHEIQRQYGGNLINLPFVSWYTPGFALWQQVPFDHRCGL